MALCARLLLLLVLVAWLSACGGGGGGGANVRPSDDNPIEVPDEDLDLILGEDTGLPGLTSVSSEIVSTRFATDASGDDRPLVAVLDTEFRLTHEQLQGRVQYQSILPGLNPDISFGAFHGTAVSSLITRPIDSGLRGGGRDIGVANDADLWVIKVSDTSSTRLTNLENGLILAATGSSDPDIPKANIANVSWSLGLAVLNESSVRDAVVPAKMAVVLAAGNNGVSITTQYRSLYNSNNLSQDSALGTAFSYSDLWVLAGGSTQPDTQGNPLHPNSNFPGLDPLIQSRFIMAPFVNFTASNVDDDAYDTFSGTSLSAPLISGMLAELKSLWPSTDMQDLIDILLESADRSSPLYQQTCRVRSVRVNCGDYFLGRGVADLGEALKPSGTLMIKTSSTLGGEGSAAESTMASWSSALGPAMQTELLSGLVAFDDFGRDYLLNTEQWTGSNQTSRRWLGERVNREMGRRVDQSRHSEAAVPHRFAASDVQGRVISGGAMSSLGAGAIKGFFFQEGDTSHLLSSSFGSSTARLVDPLNGLTEGLRQGAGFGVSYPMNTVVHLDSQVWWADSDSDKERDRFGNYSQMRMESSVSFQTHPHLSVSTMFAQHAESGGFLGSRASGALRLPAHQGLREYGLGFHWAANPYFQVFGEYHMGTLSDVQASDSLITRIDGIRTRRSHLGIGFEHKAHQFGLHWVQPLHLAAGTLNMAIPTGRDAAGNVIRSMRSANLAPSDTPQELEVSYRYQLEEQSLAIHLLESRAGGGNGERDYAGFISFQRRY